VKSFFGDGVKAMSDLDQMSQKYGISMKSAATFQELAGSGGEAFNHALGKLQVGLGSVKAGSDEYSKKLEALGLNSKEVAGLALDQAYKRVSTAIGGLADKSQQAYIAHELLGKGSEEVLNKITFCLTETEGANPATCNCGTTARPSTAA
jgi:methyl-accepting chemotaxis protein